MLWHIKHNRALSAMTSPDGHEQSHLDLHHIPTHWLGGFVSAWSCSCSIHLSHTASRPLSSLSLGIPALLTGLPGMTSGLLCHLTFLGWSSGCWHDLFLSPTLLCSPFLGSLCIARGDTALPCAQVTLTSLLEQGRCQSLTVNCCTCPGSMEEFEMFGFNQY